MKPVVVILLIFVVLNGYAQRGQVLGKVKFVRSLAFDGPPEEMRFELFIGNTRSVFLEITAQDTAKGDWIFKPGDQGELELSVEIRQNPPDPYAIEIDLTKNRIRTRAGIYKSSVTRTVLVEEALTPIEWKLASESKAIGGLQCHKAEGRFRGRDYTVWFTKEIPSRLGPWKLHGLPGLILEATDKTGEVRFYATEIHFPYSGSDPALPDINDGNFEIIGLKEYVEKKDDEANEVLQHINSKLPRGSIMTITNVSTNSVELEYEFDQDQ